MFFFLFNHCMCSITRPIFTFIYVLLYEGKCKWSYGPSCPMVFSIKYSFIQSKRCLSRQLQACVSVPGTASGQAALAHRATARLSLPTQLLRLLLLLGQCIARPQPSSRFKFSHLRHLSAVMGDSLRSVRFNTRNAPIRFTAGK